MTGWLTRHPAALSEEDRAGLKEVLARCPELDTAAGHVRDLGETLTDHLGVTLPAWIDAVDASRLPGLAGFAVHPLRDLDAVTAGLTLDWRRGSIEGAVNRIKHPDTTQDLRQNRESCCGGRVDRGPGRCQPWQDGLMLIRKGDAA
ncbi:hypothetical protein [Streptomyces sp. NPDC047841]|uniref:hypothetical protein n=1 Tax=Streptomyces sp. NPDC047841 TaxID=3154708 RepID=UPI0034546BAE